MGSWGELICQRTLDKTADGFVPGQHEARIIDPRPQRDRADLAVILTYVDDEGRACSVTCIRYRDERGWRAIMLHRAGLRTKEQSTAVGTPGLVGELLAAIERAAEGAEPFPFEEPSDDEKATRRLAHRLIDKVTASGDSQEPAA